MCDRGCDDGSESRRLDLSELTVHLGRPRELQLRAGLVSLWKKKKQKTRRSGDPKNDAIRQKCFGICEAT